MAIEYEELKKATRNFHPCELLGEGAFRRVYKGWIHENYLTATKPGYGIAVAIQKMDLESYEGNRELLVGVSSPNFSLGLCCCTV